MPRRVPQPPVDRWARAQERRTLWPGLTLVAVGVAAAFLGLGRLTSATTTQGDQAFETQVHLAFAHGGVEHAAAAPPAPPPKAPAGFEVPPWVQVPTPATPPVTPVPGEDHAGLRINLGAKDPCPT